MVVKSIDSRNRMVGFKHSQAVKELLKLSKPVSPHLQIEADKYRTQLARLLGFPGGADGKEHTCQCR